MSSVPSQRIEHVMAAYRLQLLKQQQDELSQVGGESFEDQQVSLVNPQGPEFSLIQVEVIVPMLIWP